MRDIDVPQSFPKASTESKSVRSDRRWFLCTVDASPAHHPFSNDTQAFDSIEFASRPEDTKVPPAVFTQAPL